MSVPFIQPYLNAGAVSQQRTSILLEMSLIAIKDVCSACNLYQSQSIESVDPELCDHQILTILQTSVTEF